MFSPDPTPLPGPLAQLRIMATSDLHVHLFPYDYYTDQPDDTVGLARTATLIAQARAEGGASVLLDNGDFLQGNPMGDYVAQGRGLTLGQGPHPMIAAMNVLGYDAVALGNHEFNFGLDFLDQALAAAQFPVVCANIAGMSPDESVLPRVAPFTLLSRDLTLSDGSTHPIRIGVFGLVPPQIMQWDKCHLDGRLTARDMIDVATRTIPEMRAAGADLIVALAHSGIGKPVVRPMTENAATALAALPGIDAVIAGHCHLVFPSDHYLGHDGVDVAAGTLMGKPAVMPGFWGSHLGVIDLTMERRHGEWRVHASHSEARPIVEQQRPAPAIRKPVFSTASILNAAARDHAATLTYVRRAIGVTDRNLNTYFAQVAPSDCARIVAAAQHAHVATCLHGTPHASLPLLSATAPFKAGGRGGPTYYTDIPQGDLALRHLADLYLFPNTIRAVRVTGAMVADWLEHSAGIFRQITPRSSDSMLVDPAFPCYNFDTLFGLSYHIDLSVPARFTMSGLRTPGDHRRITQLRLNGQPLDPDAEVIVATNNYRTGGGGDFPPFAGANRVVLDSPDTSRDILVRHVLSGRGASPFDQGNPVWRFAPLPGTSVLFDSSSRALGHLAQLPAHLAIDPAGDGADGFARFRIHL